MTEQKRIMVIHGPNLNMLGQREPGVYGAATLDEVNGMLKRRAAEKDLVVETFQSNHEGALVDKIQAAVGVVSGMIINPAAFTHTSVAIKDALLLLDVPVIEVHISNVYKREPFRHISMISDVVTGKIVGLGVNGYKLALDALAEMV
ncbi:MAG: type II 3-dehydroquinate dehydratase [Thermodesulfobacteriota bacterium]